MGEDAKAKLLWQLRVLGLPTPVKEHRFHATRKWRFDFAYPDQLIGIEYDGIFSAKSGHRTMGGVVKDREKDLTAICEGWTVIRCTIKDVQSGLAATAIEAAYRRANGAGDSGDDG